jgi:hypothetical protein
MRSEAVSGWRLAVSQSARRSVLATAHAAGSPSVTAYTLCSTNLRIAHEC